MRFLIGVLLVLGSMPGFANGRVAFYNVENFFDSDHDDGFFDWNFLPRDFPGKYQQCMTIENQSRRQDCLQTNWTPSHVALKTERIARALVPAKGMQAPLLLGLAEVENANVVARLAKRLGYGRRFVVTHSLSGRGIDVALLYRETPHFTFKRSLFHRVPTGPFGLPQPTRDILEGVFEVKGERLHIFVTHWPSPYNPAHTRTFVARFLRQKIRDLYLKNNKAHIIVMGDFNAVDAEWPHPVHHVLLYTRTPRLFDVHSLSLRSGRRRNPPGTHFYTASGKWNIFDRFIVSQNLLDKRSLDVSPHSYRINNYTFLSQPQQNVTPDHHFYIPLAMDKHAKYYRHFGYSDHFSIQMDLQWVP